MRLPLVLFVLSYLICFARGSNPRWINVNITASANHDFSRQFYSNGACSGGGQYFVVGACQGQDGFCVNQPVIASSPATNFAIIAFDMATGVFKWSYADFAPICVNLFTWCTYNPSTNSVWAVGEGCFHDYSNGVAGIGVMEFDLNGDVVRNTTVFNSTSTTESASGGLVHNTFITYDPVTNGAIVTAETKCNNTEGDCGSSMHVETLLLTRTATVSTTIQLVAGNYFIDSNDLLQNIGISQAFPVTNDTIAVSYSFYGFISNPMSLFGSVCTSNNGNGCTFVAIFNRTTSSAVRVWIASTNGAYFASPYIGMQFGYPFLWYTDSSTTPAPIIRFDLNGTLICQTTLSSSTHFSPVLMNVDGTGTTFSIIGMLDIDAFVFDTNCTTYELALVEDGAGCNQVGLSFIVPSLEGDLMSTGGTGCLTNYPSCNSETKVGFAGAPFSVLDDSTSVMQFATRIRYCPAGNTCANGATSAVPCSGGFYCPGIFNETVFLCPSGTYCPPGSASPIDCPASGPTCDVYCPPGTSDFACPSGTYCPNNTASIACPSGSYCTGMTCSPTTCPVGYYCPAASGSPTLAGCGNYTNTTGATAPMPCATNSFCPNDFNDAGSIAAPPEYSGAPCPSEKPVWASTIVSNNTATPNAIATSCLGTVLVVGKSNSSFAAYSYNGGSFDMIAAAFNETTGVLLSTDELGGSSLDEWIGTVFNPNTQLFEVLGYTTSTTVAGVATPAVPSFVWINYALNGTRLANTMKFLTCGAGHNITIRSVSPASGGGMVVAGASDCNFTTSSTTGSASLLMVLNATGDPVFQVGQGPPNSVFDYAVSAAGLLIGAGTPPYGANGTAVFAFDYNNQLIWQLQLDNVSGIVGAMIASGNDIWISGLSSTGKYAGFDCGVLGCSFTLLIHAVSGSVIQNYFDSVVNRNYFVYPSATLLSPVSFVGLRDTQANFYLDAFNTTNDRVHTSIFGVVQSTDAISSCGTAVYATGVVSAFYSDTPSPPTASGIVVFKTTQVSVPVPISSSSASSFSSSISSTGSSSSSTGSTPSPNSNYASQSKIDLFRMIIPSVFGGGILLLFMIWTTVHLFD